MQSFAMTRVEYAARPVPTVTTLDFPCTLMFCNGMEHGKKWPVLFSRVIYPDKTNQAFWEEV